MELKPDYKQTEVGVFPEDWVFKSLGELCVKIQDGTHFSPTPGGSDYLYVTSKNVRPGFLDLTNADRIDAVQHRAIYIRCDVKKGDILLTKDGANTGNAALNHLDEEFSLLSSVALLRFDGRYQAAEYYVQQILSAEGQRQIKDLMVGNAITRITLEKIRKLSFAVPPLPEQRAIAAALSDTDALLSSLDRLLAKKRDIKQAVMQQLLTGKQRLPGFSEGWESEQLGKLVSITKGQQLNRAELSSTGFPAWNGGIEPSGYTNVWNTSENTITISEGGNSCGFVGFVNQKFWCGGHCYALLDVSASLDKIFLYYLLKSQQQAIMGLRMGSGLPNIQRKYLSELLLSYPSPPEQAAIAAVLSDMDAERDALQERRDKTRAVKQGMMQELLTGRTRLV